MIYLIAFGVFVLAYLYGCFSTARLVAKSFRSLNIYKVGTGLADTENIFSNISRPLGVLVGALDAAKAYLFLVIVKFLLDLLASTGWIPGVEAIAKPNFLLLYGLGVLLGHCLPITHRFKGGRGIFTYAGFMFFFAPWPMIITLLVALVLVTKFKQVRFAQYMIVILPVIFEVLLYSFVSNYRRAQPPYFLGMMLGVALFMGVLNFFVSKKLDEL
ncbi:MAG: glycerol-3-phosphate acyltransferase [Candidatus Cloacimonadaceae bacterium]|jgi:glycerol-3-phosphate acyltransferase PlsY